MTDLAKIGEHDYCMWAMEKLARKMNMQGQKMNDPLIQMIDKSTGFDGVVWEDVAMLAWWTDKIMVLRKELDIPLDGIEQLNKGLKNLMKKSGKLDFYERAKVEA